MHEKLKLSIDNAPLFASEPFELHGWGKHLIASEDWSPEVKPLFWMIINFIVNRGNIDCRPLPTPIREIIWSVSLKSYPRHLLGMGPEIRVTSEPIWYEEDEDDEEDEMQQLDIAPHNHETHNTTGQSWSFGS